MDRSNMKMQEHWYLGFIGIVGLYKPPDILGFFQGTGTLRDLGNFLNRLPEDSERGAT